jgi:hypothetical protein
LHLTPNSSQKTEVGFLRREILAQTIALGLLVRTFDKRNSFWRYVLAARKLNDVGLVTLSCLYSLLQDLALVLSEEMKKFTNRRIIFAEGVLDSVRDYRYWDESLINFHAPPLERETQDQSSAIADPTLSASALPPPPSLLPLHRSVSNEAAQRLPKFKSENQDTLDDSLATLPDQRAGDYPGRAYPVQALATRRGDFESVGVSLEISLCTMQSEFKQLHARYKKELKRPNCNPLYQVYEMLQRLQKLFARLTLNRRVHYDQVHDLCLPTISLVKDYLCFSSLTRHPDTLSVTSAIGKSLERLSSLKLGENGL